MLRLSRAQWAVFFAVIFFLGFEALAVYLFVMNRRLSSELVSHSWRQPTVIPRQRASASRTLPLRSRLQAHLTRRRSHGSLPPRH